ncbi:MAG: leucyl/phenylalanyl-tRNA--protein transferase, partial [Aquabacterium sp.]|uniref:leucyl/phenylalanyl-tRNA--protein transferase n=1 Tax=Aquabacterium sp. TaxID=1872578 RepID=UPI003BAFE1C1
HSVEVWSDNSLVGGLYGIAIGGAFFGESMFSLADDASKVAFVYLVRQVQQWGFSLIDCQLPTAHLTSLGAEERSRRDYLVLLDLALRAPGRSALWNFDIELALF